MLTRQRGIDSRIQFGRPSRTAPRVRVRHKLQVQGREVITHRQRNDLGLFGLTDDLTMRAHKTANRRVGKNLRVVGLPAEQAGD